MRNIEDNAVWTVAAVEELRCYWGEESIRYA